MAPAEPRASEGPHCENLDLHSELCVTARDKEVEGHAGMPCGGLYLAARGEEVEGCTGVEANASSMARTTRGKEETVPGSKSPRETKLKSRRRSAVVPKSPSKSSGQVARLASSCAGTERARLTARMRASQMFHRSGDRAWCHTSSWLLCTHVSLCQCWSP